MIAYDRGLERGTMSQVPTSTPRVPTESPIVPAGGDRGTLQGMRNSGNEAKKWLKTKDITFLGDANYARFAHIFAQFGRWKEQERRILRKPT